MMDVMAEHNEFVLLIYLFVQKLSRLMWNKIISISI